MKPTDDLAVQLSSIIDASSNIVRKRFQCVDKDKLMQGLVIYITNREYKIHEHAFDLGVSSGESQRTGNNGTAKSKHNNLSAS